MSKKLAIQKAQQEYGEAIFKSDLYPDNKAFKSAKKKAKKKLDQLKHIT